MQPLLDFASDFMERNGLIRGRDCGPSDQAAQSQWENCEPRQGVPLYSRIASAGRMAAGRIKTAGAMARASVLVPASAIGLGKGLSAPDMDISLLGIGAHRYFIFHSAIGLAVLRHYYFKWQGHEAPRSLAGKAAGALLGAYAIGVGLHLASDAVHPKAVIFPFFGSLVDGALVDDNIWLLANSFWAFKIGHDVFALTFGSDLKQARHHVAAAFPQGATQQ